jgi:trk system potassium uptake protein TrkA
MAGKKPIGIIGLGKFGFQLGKTLIELGRPVVGIDVAASNVKRAQQLFTHVYQADASNKDVLEQIGIGDLDHVIISVGNSVAASSMIAMYLKEFNIANVWAKAIDNDHAKLLMKIGVNQVVIPEHLAARQLANRIAMPGFIDYLPFDLDMVLEQLTVKNWAGKSLREIELTSRFGVQVIAIRKVNGKKYKFVPKADDLLEKDDVVVVIGHAERLRNLEP